MVKYRMAMMPKHLKEEDDKLLDIMAARHPDGKISPKAFVAELRALRNAYGSPELRAWCKKQREIYEDKCRRGVERS